MPDSNKPPNLKEADVATKGIQLWPAYVKPDDAQIKMTCRQSTIDVARIFYDEAYDYFEKFLRDCGMNDRHRGLLREEVFRELAQRSFLREDVLALAIATAMENYCGEAIILIGLVKSLEIEYNLMVELGEKDLPMSAIRSFDDFPDLITKIFDTKKF